MKKIFYLLFFVAFASPAWAQIPNGGFESWGDIDIYAPSSWNFALGEITRETGSANSTAGSYGAMIKAYAGQDNMPGVLGICKTFRGQSWKGGTPCTAKPDSLLLDVKYELPVGTEGLVMVKFKKNGTYVKEKELLWTGVRTGSFETLRLGFDWQQGDQTPDSVLVLVSNMNFEDESQSNRGWVLVDNVRFKNIGSTTPPTLPNGSYETWYSRRVDMPTGWQDENSVMAKLNDAPALVQKEVNARVGTYALKLQNYVQPGGDTIYANLDMTVPNPVNDDNDHPAFPVSAKHTTLRGWYKFTKVSTDTGRVVVRMFADGMIVGEGYWEVGQTASSWTPITVNINYFGQNGPTPDSAAISIDAFKKPENSDSDYPTAMGNSILWIDALNFDDLITGTELRTPVQQMTLGPNPATTQATLRLQLEQPSTFAVHIMDLQGRTVYTLPAQAYAAGACTLQLPVAQLPSGAYHVVLSHDEWYRAEKLQVLH